MMPCKDSLCQVIKALVAVFALIALTCRFIVIKATFNNMFRFTKWALYAIGPAQLAYSFITLNIIDQILYILNAR